MVKKTYPGGTPRQVKSSIDFWKGRIFNKRGSGASWLQLSVIEILCTTRTMDLPRVKYF